MTIRARRKGFALAVTLAAIVIIGALIAGILFASMQGFRQGRNSLLQTRALTTAEYGLNRVTTSGEWNPNWNNQATGTLVATRAYPSNDGGIDTVRVTKLGANAFMVTSEGFAGTVAGAQARHRIGAVLTLNLPQIKMLGALTSRGSAKIGGSSQIDGNDTPISGWDCPPAGSPMPGIAVPDTTQVTQSGCSGWTCVNGSPKLANVPDAAKDSTYFYYGGLDWAGLTAMAQKVYPSGATLTGMQASVNPDGSCATQVQSNWGYPYRLTPSLAACQTYFPIIYVKGDLHASGGYGQGILLVDGDLEVSGGFEFFGPVIAKGSLKTSGTGGHFNGGVMAANVDLEQNTVLGNAVVTYSRCAVTKALNGTAVPQFARGRSWVELP